MHEDGFEGAKATRGARYKKRSYHGRGVAGLGSDKIDFKSAAVALDKECLYDEKECQIINDISVCLST